AARVALDRCVQELFDARERDDLVKLAIDLGAAHAKNGAVQIDVFAASEFRVKPRPDLKQARHPPTDFDPSLRRLRDPAQDLEQGGLSGTVAADDADDLSTLDF